MHRVDEARALEGLEHPVVVAGVGGDPASPSALVKPAVPESTPKTLTWPLGNGSPPASEADAHVTADPPASRIAHEDGRDPLVVAWEQRDRSVTGVSPGLSVAAKTGASSRKNTSAATRRPVGSWMGSAFTVDSVAGPDDVRNGVVGGRAIMPASSGPSTSGGSVATAEAMTVGVAAATAGPPGLALHIASKDPAAAEHDERHERQQEPAKARPRHRGQPLTTPSGRSHMTARARSVDRAITSSMSLSMVDASVQVRVAAR